MAHALELFTADCPLCRSFQADIELGKCGPCRLEVIDVRDSGARPRMHAYGVRVVPTLVIDSKIKVEGPLEEPWICGDEFYEMLERTHPLVNARLARRSRKGSPRTDSGPSKRSPGRA